MQVARACANKCCCLRCARSLNSTISTSALIFVDSTCSDDTELPPLCIAKSHPQGALQSCWPASGCQFATKEEASLHLRSVAQTQHVHHQPCIYHTAALVFRNISASTTPRCCHQRLPGFVCNSMRLFHIQSQYCAIFMICAIIGLVMISAAVIQQMKNHFVLHACTRVQNGRYRNSTHLNSSKQVCPEVHYARRRPAYAKHKQRASMFAAV